MYNAALGVGALFRNDGAVARNIDWSIALSAAIQAKHPLHLQVLDAGDHGKFSCGVRCAVCLGLSPWQRRATAHGHTTSTANVQLDQRHHAMLFGRELFQEGAGPRM